VTAPGVLKFPFSLCSDTLVVAPVDDDVSKAIKRLRSTKSVGLDGIPSFVVKGCSEIVAHLLTFIFNLSFYMQTFPSSWKRTAIIPVFKKGNKASVSNYRPMAILNHFWYFKH
jgi:hypothetical protein